MMMWGWGWGWPSGWGWVWMTLMMGLMWLPLVAAIVWLTWLALRTSATDRDRRSGEHAPPDAREIADRAYAGGTLDRARYLEIIADLETSAARRRGA